MEKQDLSTITLQDTGLYSTNYTFYGLLKRFDIKCVSQLVDDKLIEEISTHCQRATKNELFGFINLIKFVYLGEPIPSSVSLDDRCSDSFLVELISLGFSKRDVDAIRYVLTKYRGNIRINIDNMLRYRYIELFREILPFCNEHVAALINANMDNYEHNKALEESKVEKVDSLTLLKNQVAYLKEVRSSIDEQIKTLEQQIALLDDEGMVKRLESK